MGGCEEVESGMMKGREEKRRRGEGAVKRVDIDIDGYRPKIKDME